MATNIPPHNLGELVDALCVLIHNPDATLQELMEYMPGPDFPTGGIIMGNLGILDAYRTGRGRVVVRGKTEIESSDSRTKCAAIVVKELSLQLHLDRSAAPSPPPSIVATLHHDSRLHLLRLVDTKEISSKLRNVKLILVLECEIDINGVFKSSKKLKNSDG